MFVTRNNSGALLCYPCLIMSRFKAFLVHLSISGAIFLGFAALIFFVWYPSPYFQAEGAQTVLRVLVGVDLVLGPLLTLIVFKPGKPGLKFDLTAIAMVQIVALIYGGHVIFNERPGYIVFAVDRFNIVSAGAVNSADFVHPELRAGIFSGPRIVYAQPPTDIKERSELLASALAGGPDLEGHPQYYQLFADHIEEVLTRARPAALLYADSAQRREMMQAFALQHKIPLEALRFLPLVGKHKDMAMLLRAESGDLLGAVDMDPWKSGGG